MQMFATDIVTVNCAPLLSEKSGFEKSSQASPPPPPIHYANLSVIERL